MSNVGLNLLCGAVRGSGVVRSCAVNIFDRLLCGICAVIIPAARRMAQNQNAAELALEAGISPRLIFQHHRKW